LNPAFVSILADLSPSFNGLDSRMNIFFLVNLSLANSKRELITVYE